MLFSTRPVFTGALFTLAVFTGRVHSPWTGVGKNATVFTGRAQGL